MQIVMKLLFRKKIATKLNEGGKKGWYGLARYLAFIWFKMLISEFSRNSMAFPAPCQQKAIRNYICTEKKTKFSQNGPRLQ